MNRRVWTIAIHEYVTNVRRKEFLLITFGLPLLMLVFGAIALLGARATIGSVFQSRRQHVGIIDRSGKLALDSAAPDGVELTRYEDEESGKAAVKAGKIIGLIIVDRNYLSTGKIEVYRSGGGVLTGGEMIPVGAILSRALLLSTRIDRSIAERVVEPTGGGGLSVYSLDSKTGRFVPRTGAREAAKFVVPYLFSILLVTAIFISASYLLRGIADEKENRVIEVILSSVTPEELLKGKLIGLAAVGLTQVGLWMGFAAVPAMIMFSQVFHISALSLAGIVLFFALGFGLYATLMAGLGALGTSYRETQQISGVVSLLAFFPFILLTNLIQSPNGGLAKTLSYIPFTAPTTMVIRIAATDVPVLDLLASALILALSIWLILKLSAKLFRFGLLIYGKRPTFKETVRWLRQS